MYPGKTRVHNRKTGLKLRLYFQNIQNNLVLFYWDQPFQPKPVSNRTLFQHAVVTGHSHFQTSSTFSGKVCKMPEAQLVASIILQELLEELVPPHCESDDVLEYIATLLLETDGDTCHSYYKLFGECHP